MRKHIKINALCIGLVLLLSCSGPGSNGKEAKHQQNPTPAQTDTIQAPPNDSIEQTQDTTRKGQSLVAKAQEQSKGKNIFQRYKKQGVGIVFLVLLCYCIYLRIMLKKQNEDIKEYELKVSRLNGELKKLKLSINSDSTNKTQKTESSTKAGSNTERTPSPSQPPQTIREKNPSASGKPERQDKNASLGQRPNEDSICEYLHYHGNGIFVKVSTEQQADYRVDFSPEENTGHFEFIGDAVRAIKNKSSVLDEVCESKGYFPDATRIETNPWGICERLPNGNWKLTKKAIITYR